VLICLFPLQGPPISLLFPYTALFRSFIDVYYRKGLYRGELPLIPGAEGAGRVEAVGPGVDTVEVGQAVAWAMGLGAYAEYTVVRSEEHTSELQSRENLVCRLLLDKKK